MLASARLVPGVFKHSLSQIRSKNIDDRRSSDSDSVRQRRAAGGENSIDLTGRTEFATVWYLTRYSLGFCVWCSVFPDRTRDQWPGTIELCRCAGELESLG